MKNAESNQTLTNVLSESIRVNGTYTSASDVRISGTIDGDVHVDGTLFIGKNGVINGNIFADQIYVSGNVTGVLRSNGKITVRETGVIVGDLYTPSLAIEEHAIIEGLINTITKKSVKSEPVANQNGEQKVTENKEADVTFN
jgi:cytoskeletal protein CcmA (bactofilin family)